MLGRGRMYRHLLGGPRDAVGDEICGTETVEDLRAKLIHGAAQIEKPLPITVKGTLFPCALLSSGWWEQARAKDVSSIDWRDKVQEWLFHGFDHWGPSWDFSWDFEHWAASKDRRYYIAQLGDGDEANSLPVLIPGDKARLLYEHLAGPRQWGGMEAAVVGVLGHRRHFAQYLDRGALESFGGLLDYCLWIDPDNRNHGIQRMLARTDVYSGYLWRCVAPEALTKEGIPSLRDVYFIWEHTNFASADAVAYNLDSLARKEEYLEKRLGERLVLVQKSSSLVPGEPKWTSEEIYDVLLGGVGPKF
jgi:hypothetical protein